VALARGLEEADEPGRVLELLDAFRAALTDHFHEETCAGGMFEELVAKRPSNDLRAKSLRREHKELLAELDALRQEVQDWKRSDGGFHRGRAAFLHRFRQHEAAENDLVMSTYMVDDGGSG
jgi:hypothetical protein